MQEHTSSDQSPVLIRLTEGVLVLPLNRPDKLNALSLQTIVEIRSALKQVVASKEARLLVIAGEGRGFTSARFFASHSGRCFALQTFQLASMYEYLEGNALERID